MKRFPFVVVTRVMLTVLMAFIAVTMLSCSTRQNIKSARVTDPKKMHEPLPLAAFQPQMQVERLWTRSLGRGEKRLGFAQNPVVLDGHVYASVVTGGVFALDLKSGQVIWHVEPTAVDKKSPLRLSGGPGVGGGRVVVGSLDGQVIALDQTTGSLQWQTSVSSEIIAAPAVDQTTVYVHTTDGRLTALDAASGSLRWSSNDEPPSLSVRGVSTPLIGPGVVFVGHDDGTVSALSAEDGHPLWNQVVGSPEGRTEIERMADVDGQPVLEGDTLYVTSFKKTTIALDAPNARLIWTSPHGGEGELGVSSGDVVVSDPESIVWGLDKTTGAALWSQKALMRRALAPPAIHGDYAVVGDYKGYIHWLSLRDGAIAARYRFGHAPIRAQAVVSDAILVVQTSHGRLAAFRINPH